MKYFRFNIFLPILLILGFYSSLLFSQTYKITSREELKKEYEKAGGRILNILDESGFTNEFFNELDTVNKLIAFIDCRIDYLSFDSIFFADSVLFFSNSINHLTISNSIFDERLELFNNNISRLNINQNKFHQQFDISNIESIITNINIQRNLFFNIPANISLESEDSTVLFNKIVPYRNQFLISSIEEINYIGISNNQFQSDDKFQTAEISCPIGILQIRDNNFESTLDFGFTTIGRQFRLYRNEFNKISFNIMSFSETYNLIDWDDIKDDKIIQLTNRLLAKFNLSDSAISILETQLNGTSVKAFYEAQNKAELNYMPLYDDLIRNYYQLYSSAKQNANIRQANDIYYQLKEVERRLLFHELKQDFSAKSLVRYLLSSIMSFYTSHGTDPTRAIIISFYIIIFFGLFYSFFPSDWDKTSKKLLKQNFNSVFRKDGQFIKPLYFLLINMLLSFLNGLILSINSFVTLGFGSIPTQGIAKYACIIQGFLGWFLLSLFTVTLVNQIQY